MRPLLIIAVFITAPAQAQRVFRASSIDVAQDAKDAEHDKRLDLQDARIDRIEDNLEKVVELLSVRPAAEKPAAATKAETPVVASDPSPASVMPYAYIVKHGADWCEPCKEWDAGPRGAIEAIGWTIVPGEPEGREIPWFEIVIGDARYEHNGKLSFNQLNEIVYRHTGQRPAVTVPAIRPVSARYSTAELQKQIYQMEPDGRYKRRHADVSPRSQAKQHLVGPEHGFSWGQVSGLTQEEALILHDYAPNHGNRIFPVRRGADAQAVTSEPVRLPSSPAPANVGCANGGCANQLSPAIQGGNFRLFQRLFR